MIGLYPAVQAPGVLLRKKTFGHDYEQRYVQANRGGENQQNNTAVAQHRRQRTGVAMPHAVEEVRSERAITHLLPSQKVSAQHWCGRERNHK